MAFLLIGRGPSGDIRLLSDREFDSAKDASAALAKISGEKGFSHWDADFFVVCIDGATPVLLVKPSTAEPEAPEESPEPSPEAIPESAEETPPVIEPESEPEEESISLVTEDESEAEGSPLGAALRGAVATLESEGIVAPESIGPDTGESAEEAAPEAEWPWSPGANPEPEPEPEPESAVEPVEDAGDTFVPEGIEAPSVDDGGALVTAPGDDETMAVSRPVILGDYAADFEPESNVPVVNDALDASDYILDIPPAPIAEEEAVAALEPEPTSEPEPTPEPEPAPDIHDESVAAIIDSLAQETLQESVAVEAAPEPAPPSGYVAPDDGTAGLTCSECVYEDTCPNKDQRNPSSCGSFQWKSV